MRHILQEIFERYLNAEQAAFDTSPRELWPTDRFVLRPHRANDGNGVGKGQPARNGAAADARKTT